MKISKKAKSIIIYTLIGVGVISASLGINRAINTINDSPYSTPTLLSERYENPLAGQELVNVIQNGADYYIAAVDDNDSTNIVKVTNGVAQWTIHYSATGATKTVIKDMVYLDGFLYCVGSGIIDSDYRGIACKINTTTGQSVLETILTTTNTLIYSVLLSPVESVSIGGTTHVGQRVIIGGSVNGFAFLGNFTQEDNTDTVDNVEDIQSTLTINVSNVLTEVPGTIISLSYAKDTGYAGAIARGLVSTVKNALTSDESYEGADLYVFRTKNSYQLRKINLLSTNIGSFNDIINIGVTEFTFLRSDFLGIKWFDIYDVTYGLTYDDVTLSPKYTYPVRSFFSYDPVTTIKLPNSREQTLIEDNGLFEVVKSWNKINNGYEIVYSFVNVLEDYNVTSNYSDVNITYDVEEEEFFEIYDSGSFTFTTKTLDNKYYDFTIINSQGIYTFQDLCNKFIK